jgi:hypothetical protein
MALRIIASNDMWEGKNLKTPTPPDGGRIVNLRTGAFFSDFKKIG